MSRQTAQPPRLKLSPLPQPWSRGKIWVGSSKPCPCLTHGWSGRAGRTYASIRMHTPHTGECGPTCLSSPPSDVPCQLNLTASGQEVKKNNNFFKSPVANDQQLLLRFISCNRAIPVPSFPISLTFSSRKNIPFSPSVQVEVGSPGAAAQVSASSPRCPTEVRRAGRGWGFCCTWAEEPQLGWEKKCWDMERSKMWRGENK